MGKLKKEIKELKKELNAMRDTQKYYYNELLNAIYKNRIIYQQLKNQSSSIEILCGISIYDTKGKLKDLDTILDEINDKWNTFTETEKKNIARIILDRYEYDGLSFCLK